MRDNDRQPSAVIRALQMGPRKELFYRAVTWAATSEGRTLVGLFHTFKEADRSVLFENKQPDMGPPNGRTSPQKQ